MNLKDMFKKNKPEVVKDVETVTTERKMEDGYAVIIKREEKHIITTETRCLEEPKEVSISKEVPDQIDSLIISLNSYIQDHKLDDPKSESFKKCIRYQQLTAQLTSFRTLI